MAAIGVDIGGTHVRVARVAADGTIVARIREPTSRDPAALVARLGAAVRDVDDATVRGIGIGVPGRVDAAAGRVLSGGFVDLSGVALRDTLQDLIGKPVFVDNDCNMALVGEAACGAARGTCHSAMLTLGTGIGGALMEGGRIVRGRRTAGQLGHVVVDPDGLPCQCGRLGCLETTSSGTAFRRLVAETGLPAETTIEGLIERADAGDADATAVLDAFGRPLAAAIDGIASAFDPELILLGGGLGRAGFEVLQRLRPRPSWGEVPAIAPAALGDDAGVVGCGLAGLAHADGATAGSAR